jgi:methyl-accepting chemotaxis protein
VEAREAMLLQSLAISNEKCNALVSRLNAQVEELTQQVRNVEWYNEILERKLREDVERLSKEVKENNYRLSERIDATLKRITETVTGIEHLVRAAMEKAINSATQLLNDRVKEATDIAVIKVNRCAQSLNKKMRETEEALDEVKHEIRYESGFRRFMFWLSPVLAVAQTVLLIMLAL